MLERKGAVSKAILDFYLTCKEPESEAAQDLFEREFKYVLNHTSPFIDYFIAELEERGIDRKELRQ